VSVSSLEEFVRVLAALDWPADTLDVIGHSRSTGFLAIGTWTVDDSPQTAASFSELLVPSLRRIGVRTIRLLGCSTGIGERASRALLRISRATGCEVLGTKRMITPSDYDASGFVSVHALTRSRTETRGRIL
jgi:hypothetical protein